MGIRLDWQIESEDEHTEVEEDARVVAVRERRTKQFRNLVIFVAVASLILGSFAISRLQRASAQRRADLEAIVAAETLALRIGDQAAFLGHQEQGARWQSVQLETFNEYQTFGDRLVVDGEVLDMHIDAGLGSVVLRETLDGEPYRVIWFYEYFPDDGWYHVPPITSLLGRIRYLETEHFQVFYRHADEAYTQAVIEEMETWLDAICQRVPCTEASKLTVFIVTEPTPRVSWGLDEFLSLRVPSPAAIRVREDRPLEDPTLRTQLVDAVTWQWATMTLGNVMATHYDAVWMRDELAAWLASEVDESQPGSAEVTALIALRGSDFVSQWIARVQGGEPVLRALSLLSGHVLNTLPIAWEDFFEYRLQTEFRSDNRPGTLEALRFDFVSEELVPPSLTPGMSVVWSSIQVEAIHRQGSVWWVEATARQIGRPDRPITLLTRYSEVDGDWVIGPPELVDWHDPQQACGAHVCVHYFALDTPFAADLPPALEAAYVRALDDLAPALPERQIDVMIVPTVEAAENLAASPDAIQVLVLSPSAAPIVISPSSQAFVRDASLEGMVRALVSAATQPLPAQTPMVQAFINWETARLRGEEPQPVFPEAPLEGPAEVDALGSFVLSDYHGEGAILDSVAAWALLEAVEAVYGAEGMGTLLAALPQTSDMETWLGTVGGASGEIAPLWEELIIQALNDAP